MAMFNQKEYKKQYDKEHYSQIKFSIKKEEAEEFKKNLKNENITIAEFFKKCIKNYQKIIKNY